MSRQRRIQATKVRWTREDDLRAAQACIFERIRTAHGAERRAAIRAAVTELIDTLEQGTLATSNA